MPHDLELSRLIERHARLVRGVLRRRGVAERDLPDAQQEVFLVAHRRLPSFEGRSSHATWLCRIAFNVASQHRRLARNRYETLTEPTPQAAAPDPHAELEQREALSQVRHALSSLRDEQREAVLLHATGLSMREVAAQLGVPLKTAFSRAYAARRQLAEALADPSRWRRALAFLLSLAPLPWASRTHALARGSIAVTALACLTLAPSAPSAPTERPTRVEHAAHASVPKSAGHALASPAALDSRPSALETSPALDSRTPARRAARLRPKRARAAAHTPDAALPDDSTFAFVVDDLHVTRSGPLDPRPLLTHPLAERLGPTPTLLRGRLLAAHEGGATLDQRLAAWTLPEQL